jgi:ParB family transcriptional regulator, chromosome partitioning protein
MLKSPETSKKRMALGQGLDALLPLTEPQDSAAADKGVQYVAVGSLIPSPYQPRRTFIEESLEDLSRSIREMGVIQPLIVRKISDGKFEIVAGERRWRAATKAGFKTIPVMVRSLSDSESLELALIENLQRENLNPLDTAEAYDTLIAKFSYTHETLSQRMGKDRTSITNHLRLLRLPDSVKQYLRQDLLSMGHARTLLAVDHVPTLLSLSKKVVRRKLSVRDLERIVQNYKNKQEVKSKTKPEAHEEIQHLEAALSTLLSTKVLIKQKDKGKGQIHISFDSVDELGRLLEIMGYSADFS